MSFTAKSVIIDIADNYGYAYYVGIRSVEFKLSGTLVALTASNTTCYETSKSFPGSYSAEFAFDTTTSKTGSDDGNGWLSAFESPSNQRIICVCDSTITFDEVVINNYHSGAGFTTPGAQNLVIHTSTDTITNTTYNASISNSVKIFNGFIDQHITADSADDQTLTLTSLPILVAEGGSYTLTGSWVDFNLFPALSGSYTITGIPVSFDLPVSLTAGSYVITGSDAGLFSVFPADSGVYTITGSDIDLLAPYILASYGTYTLTGSTTSFGQVMSAGSGSFTLTGSEVTLSGIREADLVATLPALSFSLNSGDFFEATMPMLSIESIGTAGHAGEIEVELPGFSLTSYAGGYVEDSFPVFAISMEATLTAVAEIDIQLPSLGFSITASRASEADLDITFPMLQASMEATAGIVGSISGTLPRFSMGIVGLSGATADLEGTFRIMQFSATGGPSGPGTISAELPMLEMDLTSGAIESDVLRYNWERVT